MGIRKTLLTGHLSDLDIRLLRIFKAIVENRGISAAEVELNIAVPTISNYLADLENRLGMRLCQRGRSGFSLTDNGKVAYQATLELLGAMEQFKKRMNRTQENLSGTLSMGIAEWTPIEQDGYLVEILSRFTTGAPDVFPELHILMAENIISGVQEGRFNIGITLMPKPIKGIQAYPLREEHLNLYCGRSHPFFLMDDENISEELLKQQRYVESTRLRPGSWSHTETEQWDRRASSMNLEGRALLIQTGNFIGYLPKEYVIRMKLEKEMRPLLTNQFGYTNKFFILTKKTKTLDPIIEKFFDCL